MSAHAGMEDYGIVLDEETLAKPLLIFKIGVLGCAPLDFTQALADEYDAEFLSSDLVRRSIMDENEAQGHSARNINVKRIRGILGAQAGPVLSAGDDVVMDMFINVPNSRRFPLGLAKDTGALTLALWINTPFNTAAERVTQWTGEDAFPIPIAKWDIPPIAAARTMMKHVVWPQHEGIDFVFNLRGEADTDGLLEQFDEKLERFGLSDRYEPDNGS